MDIHPRRLNRWSESPWPKAALIHKIFEVDIDMKLALSRPTQYTLISYSTGQPLGIVWEIKSRHGCSWSSSLILRPGGEK